MSEIVCTKEKNGEVKIYQKLTNAITNAENTKVWKNITDSLNGRAGGQKRSVDQIKGNGGNLIYHKVGGCSK